MISPTPLAAYLHDKTIAIIGGGPSGLTLARLLQLRATGPAAGTRVLVFERDASPEARSQGGSLDLHHNSGQLAISACELDEEFARLSRPEGQTLNVYDAQGALALHRPPPPPPPAGATDELSRPEIDRRALRDLLVGSLLPGTLRWNKQLTKVEPLAHAQHRLEFSDGSNVVVDLVCGCDGANSKVRPLISAVKPHYSGISFVDTRIVDVDTVCPAVSQLVGEGSAFVMGVNKSLIAQRNGDGSIRVYAALRRPEDWVLTCGLDFANDPAGAKRTLLEDPQYYGEWAPSVKEMLAVAQETPVVRPLYTLPPDQATSGAWHSHAGATLLGDAAHLMTPFSGGGANMAMLDAVELARELEASKPHATLADAVESYERGMLARMGPAMERTLRGEEMCLSPNGTRDFVDFFARLRQGPGGAVPPSSEPQAAPVLAPSAPTE